MQMDIRAIPGAEGWIITLFVLWICILCTGFGVWFDTGPGPRGTYREPQQKQDYSRVEPIKPVRVATVSYRLDPPVQKAAVTEKPEHSLPWSCETIRAAVARLTKEQRDRLGRIYRLTDKQKTAAERCLKERT